MSDHRVCKEVQYDPKNLDLCISFFFFFFKGKMCQIFNMDYLQVKRVRKDQMKTCYREKRKRGRRKEGLEKIYGGRGLEKYSKHHPRVPSPEVILISFLFSIII